MGGVAKNPLGTIGRGLVAGVTGGLSEFAQKNPFGAPINNPINGALPINNDYLKTGSLFANTNSPYVSGPFSLDPYQVANDRAGITSQGQKQYDETTSAIDTAGKSAQDYAAQTFQRMLPGLAEDYNAGHLLNSTGYQSEAARQASNLSQDVASQVAQQKLGALTAKQGFDTGALQRTLSLEDFINQANVSKSIGAAFTPQAPTGKQNFGTVAQGIGALSPVAGLAMNSAGKLGGGGGGGVSRGGSIPNGNLSLYGPGSGIGRYS